MTLRVALIGMGRMGREIHAIAADRDVDVVATLGPAEMGVVAEADARGAADAKLSELLRGAEVAMEFTAPNAAVAHIRWCVAAGCPVVVGTTGWYDRLREVRSLVEAERGSVLWAANFSTGVAVLRSLARRAGELLSDLEHFDVAVVETHHAAKRDAPSGTAVVLRDDVVASLGRPVDITSLRLGHVPGTHEVVADGPFEQVVLRHEARDRRVFADGALRAARWLHGRSGMFTYDDVFAGQGG